MLACYQVLLQCWAVFAFFAQIVVTFDDDEVLYVDGDDILNDGKTKVEIVETGRFNEVFEDDPVRHSAKEIQAHVSSSAEDMIGLLKKEQILITELQSFLQTLRTKASKINNFQKISKSISSLDKYFIKTINNDKENKSQYESIISNPIGAFNLLWRTNKLWPKKVKSLTAHFKTLKTTLKKNPSLLKLFPENLLQRFPLTDTSEVVAGAKGLLSIQHYYNLTSLHLAQGCGDQDHQLTLEQVLEIGDIAVRSQYLSQGVEWYEQGLDMLNTQEIIDKKRKSKVLASLAGAKEMHDRHIMTSGLLQYDSRTKNIFHTNTRPYDKDLEETQHFISMKKDYDDLVRTSTKDKDLARDYLTTTPWRFWSSIYVGLDPMRQKLCQGEIPISYILTCSLLTHGNPYLMLAPFKYEEVKSEPWIGIVLDMAYQDEMERVKEEARGKLVTTTLVDFSDDGAGDSYTNRRTSKVTYRSEKAMPDPLARWTKRIELATQLDLTSHKLSSENYQIMNYGLGGAILTHRDSDDTDLTNPVYSESWNNGGPRMATVMIWASEVMQGGRTVFSGAQVGVRGRVGAALVWWNIRSDGTLDSRNHHMGCPVVRGNKWIANKWVKWPSQMWRYPCSKYRGKHYSFLV